MKTEFLLFGQPDHRQSQKKRKKRNVGTKEQQL